jgi:hypothetical protein
VGCPAARVEKELSGLPSTKRRVLDLMEKMIAAGEKAKVEPQVQSFLQRQAATVHEEFEREESNQDVIAAAIGGTVLLAGRLGNEIVDQGDVRELASLMPGAMSGRG